MTDTFEDEYDFYGMKNDNTEKGDGWLYGLL